MTLHFLCPVPIGPSGGVQKIYQFASALDRSGIASVVVHPSGSKPFDLWFDAAATSLPSVDVAFDPDADLLVVPEILMFRVQLPREVNVVVLNQGAYLTFRRGALPEPEARMSTIGLGPYAHPGLLAVVCGSADSERYLRFAFPDLDVHRFHYGIDTTVFSPGDAWRDPALAFMPRRRPDEIVELLHILGSRARTSGWALRPIDGLDQEGVAAALRASPIFLNFPVREGFPLPPLEAMACGCIVIGYTGRGGSEYLLPEYSFPVPEGDSVEFARVVEMVADEYETKSRRVATMSSAARELVRTEYTLERQDREVVEIFSSLVPEPGRVSRAGSPRIPMDAILPPAAPPPSRPRLAAHHLRQALQALTRAKP